MPDRMDTAGVIATLEATGNYVELLDDLVHEVKADEAAAINNEGPEAQVEFLLAAGVTPHEIVDRVAHDISGQEGGDDGG